MSVNVLGASAFCCLNTQIALDSLAATPAGRFESIGMTDALMSDINKRGYEQITNAVVENRRKPAAAQTPASVEIKIRKPSCETVLTTEGNLCDSGAATSDPYDYLEVVVDKVVRLNGSMTAVEFDDLCDTPDERRVITLADFANDLLEKMNDVLINEAYAVMGEYSNGVASTGGTARSIPLINTKGFINSVSYAQFAAEMRKQKFSGTPIFVGGEKLALSNDVALLGGTGDSRNLDPNAHRSVVTPFYDNQIDGIVSGLETLPGQSWGFTWVPGGMQLLEWYRNTGLFENFKEDYAETVLTVNGFTFDYSIKYDECNHKWDFTLQKRFGLFHIPDALYTCNDGNGKVLWDLTCGDIDCSTL